MNFMITKKNMLGDFKIVALLAQREFLVFPDFLDLHQLAQLAQLV